MSKILCVGDLHLRAKKPSCRLDDFLKEQERKVAFILETAIEHRVDTVLWAGDIFDHHSVPFGLVESYISIFKKYESFYNYFIFGQHDQRYHTGDKKNTPLGVLHAACYNAHVLDSLASYTKSSIKDFIYGASFGEEIPNIVNDKNTNILVIHKQVVEKEVPFFMDEAITAKDLCKQNPDYKYFICGDNHTQFTYRHKKTGQLVLNAGSVMRTNIGQIEHKPAIYLLDTEEDTMERIEIPIAQEVIDVSTKENKTELDVKIKDFVDSLGKEYNPELSFMDNIEKMKKDVSDGVKQILTEVMEGEK